MLSARLAWALLLVAPAIWGDFSDRFTTPSYSVASIVNAATNTAGSLAPNTIATIYGSNLSYNTRAVNSGDLASGVLPTRLGGVTVYVNGLAANLFYVSPTQVNFLIPNILIPEDVNIVIAREGTAGPYVKVTLLEVAPGLFQLNPDTIVATHADGSVITSDSPAQAGEVVVMYGVGLGRTDPEGSSGQLAQGPQPIRRRDLQVMVAGVAVDPSAIYYAGAAPGFAGLYQINVRLPENMPSDPEIRVALGGQISPAALKIPGR